MERKEFISQCALALAGISGVSVLSACLAGRNVQSEIRDGSLYVKRNTFPLGKLPQAIVIHKPELEFPICIYQVEPDVFHALWMRCTHQGVELQLFGDKLICPAHGSEFNHTGEATSGPATEKLRIFTVQADPEYIQISLR